MSELPEVLTAVLLTIIDDADALLGTKGEPAEVPGKSALEKSVKGRYAESGQDRRHIRQVQDPLHLLQNQK